MIPRGVTWSIVLGSDIIPPSVSDNDPIQANIPLMHSEESTYGLIATLHRWEDGGMSRQVWSIAINNGVPVLKMEREEKRRASSFPNRHG